MGSARLLSARSRCTARSAPRSRRRAGAARSGDPWQDVAARHADAQADSADARGNSTQRLRRAGSVRCRSLPTSSVRTRPSPPAAALRRGHAHHAYRFEGPDGTGENAARSPSRRPSSARAVTRSAVAAATRAGADGSLRDAPRPQAPGRDARRAGPLPAGDDRREHAGEGGHLGLPDSRDRPRPRLLRAARGAGARLHHPAGGGLNPSAANAMLKTLEEPHAGTRPRPAHGARGFSCSTPLPLAHAARSASTPLRTGSCAASSATRACRRIGTISRSSSRRGARRSRAGALRRGSGRRRATPSWRACSARHRRARSEAGGGALGVGRPRQGGPQATTCARIAGRAWRAAPGATSARRPRDGGDGPRTSGRRRRAPTRRSRAVRW